MSSREWPQRIEDILIAAKEILQITAGMTSAELKKYEEIKIVVFNFVIIGEAAKNIPDRIKYRYPDIPWRLMGDMRNVMVHKYFEIDLEIVWEAIQNNLPVLVPQLEDLLEREGEE